MKQVNLLTIISSTLFVFSFLFGDGNIVAQSAADPPIVTNLTNFSNLLYAPCRIASDKSGNIYVTDPQKGSVLTYRPWGAIKSVKGGLGLCLSVAINASGIIYVGDQKKGSVTAFDSEWNVLYKLGVGDGEFNMPNDIAIDPSTGQIYVADSKENLIKIYNSSGDRISQFGEWTKSDKTLDHLNYPTSVAVDKLRNEVLVADHNNGRVVVFDLDGTWLANLGRYGSDAGRFTRPSGICLDNEGRIYIADAYQATVQVIDRAGQPLAFIGHYGVKLGQLRQPADIMIDKYGRLLVASTNNNRIEVYGLDNYTNPEPVVEATINIRPKRLRAHSKRGKITCYIELPGHDVSQIIISSIRLNGIAPCKSHRTLIRDRDHDGERDIMVKFPRRQVLETVEPGNVVVLMVTGQVGNETFEGSNIVKVIPRRHPPRRRRGEHH